MTLEPVSYVRFFEEIRIVGPAYSPLNFKHEYFNKHTKNRLGKPLLELDDSPSRGVRIAQRMMYFRSGTQNRQKIVRVNLDTFEEVVLESLADNIADFIVDEHQTITYLTSNGELRQENVDDNSIPKTCVNLSASQTSDTPFQSLCRLSQSQFISTSIVSAKIGNLFVLSDNKNILFSQIIETPKNGNAGNLSVTKGASFVEQMCVLHNKNITFIVCRLNYAYIQCIAINKTKHMNEDVSSLESYCITVISTINVQK